MKHTTIAQLILALMIMFAFGFWRGIEFEVARQKANIDQTEILVNKKQRCVAQYLTVVVGKPYFKDSDPERYARYTDTNTQLANALCADIISNDMIDSPGWWNGK